MGKVGHGQVAVTCCYPAPQALWPVAVQWYLPKPSAGDPRRRHKARVPDGATFQTKVETALGLIGQARAWGVTRRCVGAEADCGDTPNILAGLGARQDRYVVGGRADFRAGRRDPPQAQDSGSTSGSTPCRAGTGEPSAGAMGPRAGGARSVSRHAVSG